MLEQWRDCGFTMVRLLYPYVTIRMIRLYVQYGYRGGGTSTG